MVTWWELQSGWGWLDLDLCIPHQCHCSSPVDTRGLHSFVCRRAQAGRRGTTSSMTWSLNALPQPELPWQKSQPGCSAQMERVLTLVSWQSGKSLCWDINVTCPLAESYSLDPPERQLLQRNSPLLAKTKSMPTLVVSTSLRPSQSKPWTFWTRQLVNSLPIWEERSLELQAIRGKEFFFSREFRCWCYATMLSCQPQTARTDDIQMIYISPILYDLNFKTPSQTYLPTV